MSTCPTLSTDSDAGVSTALRVVDCYSMDATALAFGRIFGSGGALTTALTILLTLYVALLAINLLTGRSSIGVNMLTSRMLVLGLVLTFATSWVAYQSVVWTLLTGAPDQIAGVVTGQKGSATAAFASRLDTVFAAVAQAAEAAGRVLPPTETGITPAPAQAAGWTASDVLWLAAMLLLLGTVGVLLVARIALAALLALGPVFIVFALFRGTHELFVGWLKGAVMFAIVPLFTVLIGGAALALLGPIVAGLNSGPVTMQGAVTMFLGAAVYLALLTMVLKLSSVMVAGWRLGRGSDDAATSGSRAPAGAHHEGMPANAQVIEQGRSGATGSSGLRGGSERVRAIVHGVPAPNVEPRDSGSRDPRLLSSTSTGLRHIAEAPAAAAQTYTSRNRGIGVQFRARQTPALGRPRS